MQSQVDDSRVALAVGANDPSHVAVEGHQHSAFAPAHLNQFNVARAGCRHRCFHNIMALLPQPKDDGPIDILISENAHGHAADWGMSTTSSVASESAAYDRQA